MQANRLRSWNRHRQSRPRWERHILDLRPLDLRLSDLAHPWTR